MGDGRPSGELLLATGTLDDDNPADCLSVQVEPSSPWQSAACQLRSGRQWHSGPLDTNCRVSIIPMRGRCKFSSSSQS